MKLHWSPRSPFVRKVMIAAHELGLVDRIETMRTLVAMNSRNAPLLPDNPLGKIPTLITDEGAVLYDSLVITDYFDALAGGGKLIPATGPARWTALTWHALGSGTLDLLILWRNEREKPAERQTAEWLDAFSVKTAASLDRMQAQVAALDAAPFGVGHIAIGVALSYADFRFKDLGWREGRPVLTGWHDRFRTRPSVISTEVVDDL